MVFILKSCHKFFSSIVDKDILEIGTHSGEFSLKNLPNSKIYTIDVSRHHEFLEAYQDDKENKIEFIKKRNKNLDSRIFTLKNWDHFKNEEFDYIWLDGDKTQSKFYFFMFENNKKGNNDV